MATIPIKLKKELIEKIDYLVKIGRYTNRSTAIREILEEKVENESIILKESSIIEEKIKPILQELLDAKDFELNLKSKKSATELVSEGRER
ncbi:MAG: ribbon-helix-helix domain-containing protein [Candidatus Helarchaeota archaeon]|nr:ribbon-helix-helix domain-containing protein [Candidatus Helarchaeota archaeon]